MAVTYETRILIDSRDVDGRGHCKASALMGHLQEVATQAAETGGFTRNRLMERYNGFWMLTRIWVQLNRPLHWEESVDICTWHRGGTGAVLYRDYDLSVGGEPVGQAVSAWVLADVNTRRILKLKQIEELRDTDGGERCKTETLHKLRLPPEMEPVERRPMHYSDTDINGHVNNTRYADFACDAAKLDRLPEGQFLSELQIGYLRECRPGEVLQLQTGHQDGRTYVCGLDESGKARFEAALFFGELVP